MQMWPYVPDDIDVSWIMFAHESFHRIQLTLVLAMA